MLHMYNTNFEEVTTIPQNIPKSKRTIIFTGERACAIQNRARDVEYGNATRERAVIQLYVG